jgi:hypothetical protein
MVGVLSAPGNSRIDSLQRRGRQTPYLEDQALSSRRERIYYPPDFRMRDIEGSIQNVFPKACGAAEAARTEQRPPQLSSIKGSTAARTSCRFSIAVRH